MTCRKCKRMLLTTRERDRSAAQNAFLASHLETCPDCALVSRQMERMGARLGGLPPAAAPRDFTAGVMGRVREVERPARASWVERVFGSLRAPAPLVSVQQVVAVTALVIMVASFGMLLGHERVVPGADQFALFPPVQEQPVDLDEEFIDELIFRHQGAASMQPLADGDGMRLVSY